MKLESIQIWTGLLANVCVIVGIIFLAVELNQNSQIMAAQTRSSITDNILYLTQLQNSPEIRDARLARARNEELSEEQLISYRSLYVQRLRHWENMVYQYEAGLFAEEEIGGVIRFIQVNFEDQIMKNLWERQRRFYSQRFIDFINEHTNQ